MSKVKVGFVGVGGIAGVHLENVSKNSHAVIVAVCDIAEESAKKKGLQYNASAYTDLDEMLEKEILDAVFVCVPPFAHGDIEEKIVKRGIHLLVEKPLGLDLETVQKKAKIIKDSGVICGVGYCLRYLDTVAKAKEYLKDKSIAMVRGHYITSFVPTPWYREMNKSGGQLVEQSTHILDLMRYLAGEIDNVYANMSLQVLSDIPNMDIPDVTSVNVTFKSGAVGHLDSSMIQVDHRSGIEILGRDFRVLIDGADLSIVEKDSTITYKSKVDFYQEQDRVFIEAVMKGDPNLLLSNYEDGAKTLAATLASNKSNEIGLPIKLSSLTEDKITL
ncbi:Gfo/Idh/MocA family protein [Metabacillus bambusae]|uniref:Gfo/Idh/MocA family oxidoreductase n=1 Tax=Metabacillus bambusae TaxID=2795218 RepID=A0ABS3N9M5_9BACI|nr:Gfo/Idh/MocA family oxidoreductase [Metabacillus bambusae]MBO1514850.1 Gfo/Idh/MocA family oxidoreductase [Metabacillus bambusae]